MKIKSKNRIYIILLLAVALSFCVCFFCSVSTNKAYAAETPSATESTALEQAEEQPTTDNTFFGQIFAWCKENIVPLLISDMQGQLAQTNQNVEDLYTILEQAQVVTVTTLEQAYTTRETADGENIVDGVQTAVKEIRGKTVATTNLIPYPYTDGMSKTINGVTFTVSSDGSVTANGTATADTEFFFARNKYFEQGAYTISGCPAGGNSSTYYIALGSSVDIDISSIAKTGKRLAILRKHIAIEKSLFV